MENTKFLTHIVCGLHENSGCYIRDKCFPLIMWNPSNLFGTLNSRTKVVLGPLVKITTENLHTN